MTPLARALIAACLSGAFVGATGCDVVKDVTDYSDASMTRALWKDTDTQERIYIPSTDITQAELERRGVKYERYQSTLLDGYLVEKSKPDKFREYTYRVLATPVTVTLDTAAVVTIVGVNVLGESAFFNSIHSLH